MVINVSVVSILQTVSTNVEAHFWYIDGIGLKLFPTWVTGRRSERSDLSVVQIAYLQL